MRAAGYGRPIPTTSSGAASGHTVAPKVGIEQRSGSNSKVNSSSSDDTAHAGEGHSKPVVARPGSSPQLGTAPTAPPAELPTVAEVLRAAKLLLQPTQAVERQFYADCYRACQVIPSSRPTVPAVAAPGSGSGGSGGAAPATSGTAAAPAQPAAYLSYVPEVALRLSCLGHRIVVRRVTDSKHYWSKSMTNMFCYCVLPGTGIGYVLDPSFKEHFRAGRMSDRYRDVWECLPPLFVGPPAKLVQLVQTLCAELQASFESGGRQLPPWRTFGSTINRWMSPCFQDVPVPPRRPMPPQAQQVAVQQQQQLLQQQQGPEQQQPGATRNTSGGDGGDSAGCARLRAACLRLAWEERQQRDRVLLPQRPRLQLPLHETPLGLLGLQRPDRGRPGGASLLLHRAAVRCGPHMDTGKLWSWVRRRQLDWKLAPPARQRCVAPAPLPLLAWALIPAG
ncbi:hypothetical protein HYH02_003622 [Chlamydomonas schloesseri]|uniref:Uncharacterized protein n=1 Tax=Chlamydomonas schloesseri TaxID=2026947 RepID=A0A835WS44_9CHLO|nr:hypothetical protein HYH02_003622 [Chlamydomonas schloesseri]|eukprot:KAG2451846.1 hypothetical protein HYH02_003622 [Chlamydomonas schloesseri]